MKKVYLVIIAVLFAALSNVRSESGSSTKNTGIITMTTAAQTVNIVLVGLGTATIDWGDGSQKQIVELGIDTIWRTYNNTNSRRITITGKNITGLYCGRNQLTSLDVSQNTALKYLHCRDNQLLKLDVSQNIYLRLLICSQNQLTALDISTNTLLDELWCDINRLSSLDVSRNTMLQHLICNENQLTELDVSRNRALTLLKCTDNRLKSLDVSQNTLMTALWCGRNQLTALDLSRNTALEYLHCENNLLTTLDVSQNKLLIFLKCNINKFSVSALNNLFAELNDIDYHKILDIRGNQGTANSDANIAEAKGWFVIMAVLNVYPQNIDNNDLVLQRTITRSFTGQYISKNEFEYDVQNNQLIERLYFRNRHTNDWNVHYKYVYDNDENQILYKGYTWNNTGNMWELHAKSEFEIGDNDVPILYSLYTWDNDNWKINSISHHDVDADNNPMTYITYMHDFVDGKCEWCLHGKKEIYFDDDNNEILHIYHRPNMNNGWTPVIKSELEHDTNNNHIMTVQNIWDDASNSWIMYTKSEFYYTVRTTTNENTINLSADDVLDKDLLNIANYPETNDTSEHDALNTIIFPNPASDYITIRGAATGNVTIFDITGRIVYRQGTIGEDEIINVSFWNIGLYLVVVELENERTVHKIIKN